MNQPRRLGWLILGLALAVSAGAAQKDKKREATLRAVHGVILDKSESPLTGGIVFLKNMRTKIITTHISDADGNYRFSRLDPNVDYEIHAEKEGMTSITRTISSFDSRTDVNLTLKLDHKLPEK